MEVTSGNVKADQEASRFVGFILLKLCRESCTMNHGKVFFLSFSELDKRDQCLMLRFLWLHYEKNFYLLRLVAETLHGESVSAGRVFRLLMSQV